MTVHIKADDLDGLGNTSLTDGVSIPGTPFNIINHGTQNNYRATGSVRPVYRATGWPGGLPCMDFTTGFGQVAPITDTLATTIKNNIWEVFAVAIPKLFEARTSDSNNYTASSLIRDTASPSVFGIPLVNRTSGGPGQLIRGYALESPSPQWYTSGQAAAVDVKEVVHYRADGGSPGPTCYISTTSVPVETSFTMGAPLSVMSGLPQIIANTLGNFYYAELIIYDRILSASERTGIRGALEAKWLV